METKDIIKTHRLRLGLSEQQLADKLGVSRGSVQQWEKGTTAPNRNKRDAVAESLGLTVSELLGLGLANTAPVEAGMGVPLISWEQAGAWSDAFDPHQIEIAAERLPCPAPHGPRTYCLKVRGDSMHNPTGRPSYSDGDFIFVDPDRAPSTGDRVVVRVVGQRDATFKQLVIEDGRQLLKALNADWSPRYIEIDANAAIAGVVIGKWVPE